MRCVVLGAGAIGAGLGALLRRGGLEVVLVARGAHLEALKRGLILREPDQIEQIALPVCALEELEPRPDDLLAFACKLPDTAGLLEATRAWGEVTALSLQGGLVADAWLAERFPRVIGSVVYVPANVLRPGEVTLWGTPVAGRVVLGAVKGEVHADIAALVSGWRAGGLLADVHGDIAAAKRRKLWVNLAGLPWALSGEVDGPASQAARAEALAVFEAAGLSVAPLADIVVEDLGLAEIQGERRPGPSLADSLRRGRTSEGHWTYGEMLRLAEAHGAEAPVIGRLYALLREAEAAGALPQGWTQARLAQG